MQAYDFEVEIPPITARAVPRDDGKYVLRSEIPQRRDERGHALRPGVGDAPDFRQFDKNPQFSGLVIEARWNALEPTPGRYTFDWLHEAHAECAKRELWLAVMVSTRAASKLSVPLMPSDIAAVTCATDQLAAPIWRPDVRARLGGCVRALGDELDGKLAFVVPSESSPGNLISKVKDYNAAQQFEAIKGVYATMAQAFKLTPSYANVNTIDGRESELLDYAGSLGLGHWSEDLFERKVLASNLPNLPRPRIGHASHATLNEVGKEGAMAKARKLELQIVAWPSYRLAEFADFVALTANQIPPR